VFSIPIYIRDLKKTGLKFVLAGSTPLAVRGIRPASDFDLVVEPALFDYLRNQGWTYKPATFGLTGSLVYKNAEAFLDWNIVPGRYNAPDLGDLLREADYFHGMPFVSLRHTIQWKLALGRKKDIFDSDSIINFWRNEQREAFKSHSDSVFPQDLMRMEAFV